VSFLCAPGTFFASKIDEKRGLASAIASDLAFGAAGITNAVVAPFGSLLALCLMQHKAFSRETDHAASLRIDLPRSERPDTQRYVFQRSRHYESGASSWPEYHVSYHRKLVYGDSSSVQTLKKIDTEYRSFKDNPA
jgi:hypothetical protein